MDWIEKVSMLCVKLAVSDDLWTLLIKEHAHMATLNFPSHTTAQSESSGWPVKAYLSKISRSAFAFSSQCQAPRQVSKDLC